MSGGHFDYQQYKIDQIAEDIKTIIHNQGNEEEPHKYYQYSEQVINEFKKAVVILDKAYVYAQRIDWLVSGDDGEESFHQRLKEELERLET